MLGFVIAVLACSGSSCNVIQPEPENTYASFDACSAAMATKTAILEEFVAKQRAGGRTANLVCLQAQQSIVEVEDTYDVLETVIVHTEPSANAGYVGVAESGQRVVVTGEVAGTGWLRVILRDGKSGFVYGERLRRVGARSAPAPTGATPPPATAVLVAPVPTPPKDVVPPPQQQAVAQPPPSPPQQAVVPPAPPPPAPPPPAPPPPAPTAAKPVVFGKGEFRDCEHCPVMTTLSAGVLAMGSNDDPTEKPVHRVGIRPFAIGKYPVTVAEWIACVTSGGCSYRPTVGEGDTARTPVTNVSWSDALEYTQWLQQTTGKPYRMPSEAEWEYAARAGTTTRYWWGEQPGAGHADCTGCGGPHDPLRPALVDAYPPNPWGLFSMSGGVAEWVDDCWHLSYLSLQGGPTDGSAWRAANCGRHVLRGGSWKNPPSEITVSNRNFYDTTVRYVANGLRAALSLQ